MDTQILGQHTDDGGAADVVGNPFVAGAQAVNTAADHIGILLHGLPLLAHEMGWPWAGPNP